MTPSDAETRETALDPSRSFIVEAPAGSGKTELLIQRYLRLLATVERPESVVAMTFTRKAAAEMKQRIVEALIAAKSELEVKHDNEQRTRQLARDVLQRDARRGWGLLENQSALQIQTIDSLCGMLTRQMPLLSDFGGMPRIEEHAEELYRVAARRALAAMAAGEPEQRQIFRSIVSHFESDLSRLEKQIMQMLTKRDQWLDLIAGGRGDIDRERINRTLEDCCLERIRRAYRRWPDAIPGRPPLALRAREDWKRFANLHLYAGDKKTAKKTGLFYETLDQHLDFCAALNNCRKDLPLLIDDDQWDLVHDFVRLLAFTVVQLRQVFEENGVVDFTEVTRAAIQSLGTPEMPTDLLYRLDYRIEHLLVDEFQDTSVSQYNLIKALTAQWSDGDNRTLFVVGDPMQSIYGFRQAEVRLFLDATQGAFQSVSLKHLKLTANFRSTQAIVEWVNQIFVKVMKEDDFEHGGVKYQPSVASRSAPAVRPLIQAYIEDNGDEEADWIAARAKKHLAAGDTVAVLVKARSHSVKTIQAFRKQGIAYEAREIDELQNEQHILDILALARAILHAGDRLSWLACLRAPWCGLTLADLSALAEGQSRRSVLELLYDLERIAAMTIDGRTRAIRTGEILAAAVREVGHHPIRNVVESAWVSLGGAATLTHPSQFEDVEVMFSLLDQFDEGGVIRDFSLLRERLKFLYAKPQTGGARVQIMTIHAAKGLEFDTVFIPHLHTPWRPEDQGLLAWIERRNSDGELGVLIAGQGQTGESGPLYKFVSSEMRKKEEHESGRLLYVAATRAKNFLYLSSNLAENSQGSSYAAPQGFLKLIWSDAQSAFDDAWSKRAQSFSLQQVLPFSSSPQTLLRRLPVNWEAPHRPPDVSITAAPPRKIASSRRVTYEWVSDVARHVGTVVHEYLRGFAADGADNWTKQRVASQKQTIESELRRLGTAQSELGNASKRVLRALENVLQSDRARWILSPAAEARSEWAVSGVVDGRLFDAIVDRTLVDAEGRRWIVDFKTSEHLGGSREEFLEEEKRRYTDQMSTYSALVKMREDRPIMLGLYFPLHDAWIEWRFAEQALPAVPASAD